MKTCNSLLIVCLVMFAVEAKKLEKYQSVVSLPAQCVLGLARAIPRNMCFKTNNADGVAPTACPRGYTRTGLLCAEKCKDGFESDGNLICRKKCPIGLASHNNICVENSENWFVRTTYTVESISNFDPRVPCPEGKFKHGALCYSNCNTIGMVNCGNTACAVSEDACSEVPSTIKLDENLLFKLSEMIAERESRAEAKRLLENGLKKATDEMLEAGANAAYKAVNGKHFKKINRLAIANTQAILQKETKYSNTLIFTVCSEVNAAVAKMMKKKFEGTLDNLHKSAELLSFQDTLSSCRGSQRDGGIKCARDVMKKAAHFNISGILTVGSVLLSGKCELPDKVSEPSVDYKLFQEYQRNTNGQAGNPFEERLNGIVSEDCIQFFTKPDFEGESTIYCGDVSKFNRSGFSKGSIKVGPYTTAVVYAEDNFKGKKTLLLSDNYPSFTELDLKAIKSFRISRDSETVILYEKPNWKGFFWLYKKGEQNPWIGCKLSDKIASAKVGSAVKVTVFDQAHFKGASASFPEDTTQLESTFDKSIASLKIEEI